MKSNVWLTKSDTFREDRSGCKSFSLTQCCHDLLQESYNGHRPSSDPFTLYRETTIHNQASVMTQPESYLRSSEPGAPSSSLPVQAILLASKVWKRLKVLMFVCVDTRTLDRLSFLGEVQISRVFRITCNAALEVIQDFNVVCLIEDSDIVRKLQVQSPEGMLPDARRLRLPGRGQPTTGKRRVRNDIDRKDKTRRVTVKAHERDCVDYDQDSAQASSGHLLIASTTAQHSGLQLRPWDHDLRKTDFMLRAVDDHQVNTEPSVTGSYDFTRQNLAQQLSINARPQSTTESARSGAGLELAYERDTDLIEADIDNIMLGKKYIFEAFSYSACATASSSDITLLASSIDIEYTSNYEQD